MAVDKGGFTWGVGRRKTAVARVRIRPGSGVMEINGRPLRDFFSEIRDRADIHAPLELAELVGKMDVFARVAGGGFAAQAGAVRLGVARALIQLNREVEKLLRDNGHLTRDSRMKERKKYGQKGARKKFQFSKR